MNAAKKPGLLALAEPTQTPSSPHSPELLQRLESMAPDAPKPSAEQFMHIPPPMEDLKASAVHPKLKEALGSSIVGIRAPSECAVVPVHAHSWASKEGLEVLEPPSAILSGW